MCCADSAVRAAVPPGGASSDSRLYKHIRCIVHWPNTLQAMRGVELRTPDTTYPPGVWAERREAKRVPVARELVLEDLPYGGKK